MYHTKTTPDPIFTDVIKLELSSIERRSPGRSGRRTALLSKRSKSASRRRWTRNSTSLPRWTSASSRRPQTHARPRRCGDRGDYVLHQYVEPERDDRGRFAGQKAVEKGLTSSRGSRLRWRRLSSGRRVLEKSGLQKSLDAPRLQSVGFGCTTSHRQFGAAAERFSEAINKKISWRLAVLSGIEFRGRVNADVRANYLASPPLVVAYAIAGSMQIDVAKAPLGTDQKGRKVYLRDIWPSSREIATVINKCINKQMFTRKYGDVFKATRTGARSRSRAV